MYFVTKNHSFFDGNKRIAATMFLYFLDKNAALFVEIYESLEEKAANLLYFVTKNHSFFDGNKRIAATMFLYFLDKNAALFVDGKKKIEDSTLVH